MSEDIWHNPPQTPDVFKSHPIIVIYEAGDQIEQMDSTEYSDLVGERYVNRWCYVDELIKENDCTRKALEITTGAIDEILYLDSGKFCKEPAEMWKIAKSAKDKITVLNKGGDNE